MNQKLLLEFEDCLKKYSPHVLKYFGGPLSDKELKYFLDILDIDILEYKQLYSWKNGIDIEAQDYSIDIRIDFAGNFVSLEDTLEIVSDNNENDFWPISMIPLMSTHEGETLLIEKDSTSDNYGCIFYYSPSSSDLLPITYFDNIESMLYTIIALFEKGAQRYQENEERMIIDFELRAHICKQMNPRSERWM